MKKVEKGFLAFSLTIGGHDVSIERVSYKTATNMYILHA